MRRTRLVLLVALALLVAAICAGGAASQGPVPTYTGCFDADRHDRQISELALGDVPKRPCGRDEQPIRLSGGDLTGLGAGAGLQGGGDNGELTLAIAPGYRLPQSCASGEVPGWSGAAWACLDPASQAEFDAYKALLASVGTINDPQNPVQWTKLKGVPAGLADGSDDAGGPASGDLSGSYPNPELAAGSVGTAELAAGAVTTAKLADSAVTTAKLADSAVTSAKIFDSTILLLDLAFDPATQAELDALAQPGTINAPSNPVEWTKLKGVPEGLADGIDNVNERPGVPAPNGFATAENNDNIAAESITIGADGLGFMTYRDQGSGGSLKVAHCENIACSSATIRAIAGGGFHGQSSVAIGSDGLPVISYFVFGSVGSLNIAHCSDVACSATTRTVLDPGGDVDVGRYSSITIGSDGLPLISYAALYPVWDLKVAHCQNVLCSAAATATIDSAGFVGYETSIALGADGLGLISYRDSGPTAGRNDLKVAHCQNVACSGATTATIADAGGGTTEQFQIFDSLTIGADGLGLISYYDNQSADLQVAHCSNIACSSATTATLDSDHDVGQYTSATIGADGLGVISYADYNLPSLKVAHCRDVACSSATTTALGAAPLLPTAISIGVDGVPLIAYTLCCSPRQVKIVHCANTFCLPYFRRR